MVQQTQTDDVDAIAATVVLLRDSAGGPEVLLLERPRDHGSFAGGWVFPGGVVEPGDIVPTGPADAVAGSTDPASGPADIRERDLPDVQPEAQSDTRERAAATVAATRETWEETGLVVPGDQLTVTACWVPPAGIPKRIRTWFFLAAAPLGEVVLSPDESVGFAWLRPADALTRHAAGTLRLFPPTWVTLHGIAGRTSVDDAVRHARADGLARFESRMSADRRTIYWRPDVAFVDDAFADVPGPRHRIEMGGLPWAYRHDSD